MSFRSDKLALFIDGANLYARVKALGFDIDYRRLPREFQGGGRWYPAQRPALRDQRHCSPQLAQRETSAI
jgi:uncharacterized LabA/DUF88 family protein